MTRSHQEREAMREFEAKVETQIRRFAEDRERRLAARLDGKTADRIHRGVVWAMDNLYQTVFGRPRPAGVPPAASRRPLRPAEAIAQEWAARLNRCGSTEEARRMLREMALECVGQIDPILGTDADSLAYVRAIRTVVDECRNKLFDPAPAPDFLGGGAAGHSA